jgi:hypothetical protein
MFSGTWAATAVHAGSDLCTRRKTEVAVSSVFAHVSAVDALGMLARFRQGFYACLYVREDALFELADALLCAQGPIKTLVELSLVAEHRRGHGGMYAALNEGDLEPERLRWALAAMPPVEQQLMPMSCPFVRPGHRTNLLLCGEVGQ